MERNEPGLIGLLQDIHGALRQGDLGRLGALTSALEAAEQEMSTAKPAELAAIRNLAERNAHSLQAARRGMVAARRRLAEVLSAARGLVTYDQQGQRVERSEGQGLARRY